jgi:hypothetical protein
MMVEELGDLCLSNPALCNPDHLATALDWPEVWLKILIS